MQSTEDRVILWEQWMNSRNTLRKKELDEMKDHLLEEIEYLMTHENLSEEEAFHKAVDTIGKKKELIEEEIKVKQENIKRKWKIVISCMVSLCIVGLSVCTIQYTHQKRSQVANSIPYGYPCDGDIDVPYGHQIHRVWKKPHWHKGVDFELPLGSDITATADGVVIEAAYSGGYGNMILIQHTDQISTRYAHCSELLVQKGDVVKRGQIVAKAGRTGAATYSQVHYEIIINGDTVNPEEFNKNVYADQIKFKTSKINTNGECSVTFIVEKPFSTEDESITVTFPKGTRLPDDLSCIEICSYNTGSQ